MPYVSADHQKALLTLTLDRPAALNALNDEMINEIKSYLNHALESKTVNLLLFKGAGGKAFCAGGDIKAARAEAIAIRDSEKGIDKAIGFFKREYALNKRLFHFDKPTISFMNGITMGGGVGIADACHYKVATEKTVWAMPEVSIGFFPDVGAAYYLSRAPHFVGRYLALTGDHLTNPADLIKCGLATHFILLEDEEKLISALQVEALDIPRTLDNLSAKLPEAMLPYEAIEECFAFDDVGLIIEKLDKRADQWSMETSAVIKSKSPTSLKIALRHVIMAEKQGFDEVIDRDLHLAEKFMQQPDFIEGVRSVVIDKDRNPKWNPPALDMVGKEEIDGFFN